MAELVSKTYASALFEVAIENNQLDQFREELNFVLDTFEKYPEFYRFYVTPQISKEEKKQVLQEVFKGRLSIEVLNFFKIILDKRRTNDLNGIVKKYIQLVNAHQSIIEGIVITAIPLKNEDKMRLEKKLSTMTNKKIQLKNEVDPSIIGGILVRIGDKVIDGTIQSRLNELQKDLAQIIV